jgi:3-hydroxyacyl-[acyl-carrier-protein] dehydratase
MRWLLVDRIDVLISDDSAQGTKVWPADSEFFEDHFPKFPVVPGVLLLEALAQLAGKLIGYSVREDRGDWPFPILSMMNGVKFRKFVRPDEEVILETRLLSLREEMAVVQSRARCGGKTVAQAEQIFVFNAVPLENDADRATVERLERAQLKKLWAGYPEDE